jgi:LPXTG-motif cell wall-anchored protein
VDWNSARAKLLVVGPILIVLGLVLYIVRGDTAVLVFPVIGIVLLIAGILYKPRKKKTENIGSEAP